MKRNPVAHKFTKKDSAAGGRARAKALTKQERSKSARNAVNARWAEHRAKKAARGSAA